MGSIKTPASVRLFTGVLYSDARFLERGVEALAERFGAVKCRSPVFYFDFTDYYEKEMGKGLRKVFIAFEEHIEADELADIKKFTNSLEKRLALKGDGTVRRRVNIDPGYVDMSKVVLASTKNRYQRIYLREGVYGEVTLLLKVKTCEPLQWTYMDFRTPLACRFFISLRTSDSR